ncbi:MAG: amino acid adenylation domain-containing protein [Hamadaea sp.]|nr:amino acid adenylation domain-containing protein [Hamadaea sp.]
MSDVQEILADFEGLGARFWADGENLRYRAPAGVMTDERLSRLRAYKSEILAVLLEEETLGAIEAQPEQRHAPFPLTDIQAAYLVGRSPSVPYGGLGCHGYGELHLADFDADRLRAAWAALVERHDALRLRVDPSGIQEVRPEVDYHVVVDDQRGSADGFHRAMADRRERMSHRVYAVDAGALFDLQVTWGDDDCVLHLSIDFLIADFVSLQILLSELATAYRDPASLGPAPEITFRDCVIARQRLARSRRRARDEAYWRERLDGFPRRPELPVRSPDEALPRFSRLTAQVPGPVWAALRDRAARQGLTANAAVLSAYAETLGRWSAERRFGLSVTVLSRPDGHPDVPRVVGDFTSVDLLAVDRLSGATFGDRARAVQETLADDLDHGLFSGIDVIRELRRRDPANPPMYPVVFTSSLGLRRAPEQGAGGTLRLGHGISQTPQVWLDCQVMEADDGLTINWDHRDGVFRSGVVEAMFAAFEELLTAMAAGDEVFGTVSPIEVPAAQRDRRPVLAPAPADRGELLHDKVFAQAARTPERTAVVANGRAYRYADVVTSAHAVAAWLLDRGLLPGEPVAVEMDKGWEQIPAVLGTLLAGGAYVPVDTTQPAERRRRILRDTGVRCVLTQSFLTEPAYAGMPVAVGAVDVMPAAPAEAQPVASAQPAYIMYTSGTTGAPKGVVISHKAVLTTLRDVVGRFAVTPDSRVLGLASLGFDLSVFDIFGPLSVGGRLVLPDAARRNDPAHWADLVVAEGVTHWNSVPAQLDMLLAYADAVPGLRLDSLREVLLSGDWVAPSLRSRLAERADGFRMTALGGATEASIWSIQHPMDDLDPDATSVPYGRPLTHQSVLVLDELRRDVPDHVTGELYIGGAALADGYFGDAALTADRFSGGLYRTGDLGRFLPDGAIEFLGRRDSQVKIRGHRVELGEIEAALEAYPAVSSAVAVAYGSGPSRQLAAFVTGAAAQPPDADAALTLGQRAVDAAAASRAGVSTEAMLRFARELDTTGLLQMLATLRDAGLFTSPDDHHDLAEILETARVAPRHRRLVRRWVAALTTHGLLAKDPQSGRYRLVREPEDLGRAWQRVGEAMAGVERRPELVDYFRTTAACLPQLVRGEIDPLEQLFPAGRTDIHEVAYNGIFLSHYLNELLVGMATQLAAESGPPNILEIGSGVGGTSVELIPAMARFGGRYTFTDVSRFFLNNAQERFASYDFLDYRLYDMNADYWTQGLRPNSYSLIVCANVLHYARDVNVVLERIRELLRPGGWLLFIEATHDNHQIMTSMEFLFDEKSGEFQDVRGPLEQTFVSVPQWNEALTRAGADSFAHFPQGDPITDEMGMHVFAARFKARTQDVDRAGLQEHLLAQLPDHMLPGQLVVLDRIPLTANGKADRALLTRRAEAASTSPRATGETEQPVNDLEKALAEIYAARLGRPAVGRTETFYDLGGDSLLATQIAAQICADVPAAAPLTFDRILRVIFDNASVARLAEEVATATPLVPAGASTAALVVLAPGEGTPTILVHDGSGTLRGYAGGLPAGPVLGIEVTDAAAYRAIDAGLLVERLAEQYTGLVTATGALRVRLAGSGFGGLVAFELARQLAESGLLVERLTVDVTESESSEDPVARQSAASGADWMLLPYAGDVTVVCPADADLAALELTWGDVCLGELTLRPGATLAAEAA